MEQILAVVLGLYSIVMLQSKLFSVLGIFNSWSPEIATLANNLITSSTFSLFVMPLVARRLRFWLQPAYHHNISTDFFGTIIVATALVMMVILFHLF